MLENTVWIQSQQKSLFLLHNIYCPIVRIDKDDMAELQMCQSFLIHLLIGKSGRLYICVVVCLLRRHGGNSSNVILAFEHAFF